MFDSLTEKLTGIFGRMRRKGRIGEGDFDDAMREVRIALLEADVNLKVVKDFVAACKERAVGEQVWESLTPDQMVIGIVRDEMVRLLGEEPVRFNWAPSPPTVILLCGLQGSGKTTTAAKLALQLKKLGKKPMLAACDLQRPAAIKQLQVLGESTDTPVFADMESKDPVRVARAATDRAKHLLCDTLIVDTAGRLQIDDELMGQIRNVREAVKPSEVFLVADSTTGQEAVNVAQAFDEALGLTGLIFTKLDGDTRGGALLSVRAVTGKPVRYIGVGEGIDALEEFDTKRVANRILGFGDVIGLFEKAQEAIDEEQAADLAKQFKSGRMDFDMLLTQFKTIKKMGSIRGLMKMIPGMSTIPKEVLDGANEGHIGRMEALILSMTPAERRNPDILNGSRKRRIAAGSGSTVEEVNRLVKALDEMQRQMKQVTKMARFQKNLKGRGARRR